MKTHFYKWATLIVGCVVAMAAVAPASAQSVQAALSADTVRSGQVVELHIRSTGRNQPQMLDEIDVPGLSVVGTSSQFQMQMSMPQFKPEVISTKTFMLVATAPGEYQIPEFKVRLDGKVLKTNALTLKVLPSGSNVPVRPAIPVPQPGAPPGSQPLVPNINIQPPDPQTAPDPQDETQQDFFGEMVVPRQTAYVGEIIPVDLRFNIDARFPSQFGDRPSFSGEGFTVREMSRPSQVQRDVDGTEYTCAVFRTAITPAKAGPLEIPAAALPARYQAPMDVPNSNDMFGMLRNFGMTDIREIEITTEPAVLEVKALPKEGKPENFAGAVGEFKIQVTATPAKTGPGEPVTLKVEVSGRGNFEAMGPPALVNADGWKVYDPSESFEGSSSDPIGFNGTKTYEFTLVAREDQKTTPPVVFSYFDPAREKYVTLEGPPVSVDARGSGIAAPSAPAVAAVSPTPDPGGATPTPQPGAAEATGLSRDFARASFQPVAWSQAFVVAGALLAVAWVAAFSILAFRRYQSSPAADRARFRKELRQKLQKMKDPSLKDEDFLSMGAELISLSAPTRKPLAGDLEERVSGILNLAAESKYSVRRATSLAPESRQDILKTLDEVLDHS